MKKIKSTLFIIAFILNAFLAKTQTPGATCASAFSVSLSSTINNIKQSSPEGWFVFTSNADTTRITIVNTGLSTNKKIKKILVGSGTCSGFFNISVDSLSSSTDSTLIVNVYNLQPFRTVSGTTFYIQTIRQDSSECPSCTNDTSVFNLQVLVPPGMKPCTFWAPSCATGSVGPNCELVCNGSFETQTLTVSYWSQLPYAYGWTNPTSGTPDLHSASSTNSFVSVSCNAGFGSQSARTGNSYAGIFTGDAVSPRAEYIETNLNTTLSGGYYEVSFWVSRADFQPYDNDRLDVYMESSLVCLGTSTMGAPTMASFGTNFPVYTETNTAILNDFNSWREVKFIYCSNGSENYLMIGNHIGSAGAYVPSTPTAVPGCTMSPFAPIPSAMGGAESYGWPYIYIDDVSVKEINYTLTATPNNVCPNTPINFSITGCPTPTVPNYFVWNFGDGSPNVISGNTIPHTYSLSGSYTVVVTINAPPAIGGCPLSYTTVINIIPAPPISASASPSTICSGKSSTLTASGTFTSYTWSTSQTGSSIVVNPTVTTIYTVTGTSATGCMGTNTVQVNVSPLPNLTVTASSPWLCNLGGYPPVTLTVTGANTYTWLPTGATSSVITHGTFSTTTYTVIGTSVAGCTNSTTYTVNVVDCCTSCSVTFFTPKTFVGSNTYSNNTICVDFPVTVAPGADLTFIDCELKINATNTITVRPTATLNIVGSHLYACTDMWQGIDVKPGGVVNIINSAANSSLIEDAFIAVNIQSYTLAASAANILTANNATFNRNQIAININGYTKNQVNYPFTIVNCLFTSRKIGFTTLIWPSTNVIKSSSSFPSSPLQAPYITSSTYPVITLKTPLNTSLPSNGIILNTVGFTNVTSLPTYKGLQIGQNGTPNYNLFDNLYECITANNSNFTVINSVFQNGQRFGKGNSAGGKAIYAVSTQPKPFLNNAVNNQIRVIPGASNNFYNKFYEFTRCVDVKGYLSTEIRGNEAYSYANTYSSFFTPNALGGIGFALSTNRYFSILINQNKMYNIKNNILFDLDQGFYFVGTLSGIGRYVGHASFDNNIIDRHPTTAAPGEYVNIGININDPFATAPVVYALAGGINLSMSSNSITNVHNGIGANNVPFVTINVITNTITMVNEPNTLFAFPAQSGISTFQIGKTNNIWQNVITGPITFTTDMRGIKTSMNSNLSVRCNSVNNTARAMDFNASQAATTVEDNVMQITGTSTNPAYGLSLDNNALISTQGNPTYPQDNQWLGTNWSPSFASNFKTLTVGSGSSAFNSKMYVQYSGGPLLDPNLSSQVLSTALFFADDYFHNGGPLSTLLNVSITQVPSCRISSGGSGNKAAQKSLMEQLVSNAISYPVNASKVQFIDKNRVYRTIKDDNSWMTGSTILSNFYTTSQTGCLQSFCDIENELMTGTNITAQTKINSFAPSSTIEANYKNYFQILLNVQDTTYSSSDSTALITLANSCPYTEGGCVYQARALYNIVYKDYFRYNDNCNANSSRLGNSNINESINDVNVILKSKIYPNPNSGDFYISVADNKTNQNLEVQIFDVSGKIIYNDAKTSTSNIVKLNSDLANGVYLVKVKLSDGSVDVHRLIINK